MNNPIVEKNEKQVVIKLEGPRRFSEFTFIDDIQSRIFKSQ